MPKKQKNPDDDGAEPEPKKQKTVIKVDPPRIDTILAELIGETPYVSNRMGETAIAQMKASITGNAAEKKQIKAGEKAKGRNFDLLYQESMHSSEDGWKGIPAAALRKAMVDACRLVVGAEMTTARMAIFVIADGISTAGIPLLKIKGEPKKFESRTVTKGRVNLAVRARWDEWSVNPAEIQYDADVLTSSSIVALLQRVGQQVGLGAGRHFSTKTTGMGWGCFRVGKVQVITNKPGVSK